MPTLTVCFSISSSLYIGFNSAISGAITIEPKSSYSLIVCVVIKEFGETKFIDSSSIFTFSVIFPSLSIS